MDGSLPRLDPRCAICGAPPFPECPHEGERLQLALQQAQERWAGVERIRDWVLNNARNHIIHIFERAKHARYETHVQYLHSLPYYALYTHHRGRPPLPPHQLAYLQEQLRNADLNLRIGVDADWRTACMMYPDMLDYFFNLVVVRYPDDRDEKMTRPELGVGKKRIRRDSAVSEKGGRKGSRARD